MTLKRRALIGQAGLLSLGGALPNAVRGDDTNADYTLRIANGLAELAPDHIVSTTLYNDQFPGPLLRFTEGQRVVIDIHNDTDTPELVHWHGQMIPSDVDGAAEEGSPYVPRTGCSASRFYQSRQGSGFITRMSSPGPISIAARIPARSGRFTLNRKPILALTTAKYFWC